MFTKKHTNDNDLEEEREARHVDEHARNVDDSTTEQTQTEQVQTERAQNERTWGREAAQEQYGGLNVGAAFFGWLVAIAVATLLTGIIGAIVAGVSETANISQSDAEREAGNIGIAAAVVLVLVVAVGYFTGGYVAGRMSRFDGARQGFGVWLIGLVVMIIAGVTGALFGREYNVLDRVDLPQLPLSSEDASTGALITGVALLLTSLFAALAGGKVGRNYHSKVDAAHLTGHDLS